MQEVLVVLDLLGTELGCSTCTRVWNYFEITSETYQEISTMESRLEILGLLEPHQNDRTYFNTDHLLAEGALEDDHIPFWQRGIVIFPPSKTRRQSQVVIRVRRRRRRQK